MKLDILICTYNNAAILEETLKCLARQQTSPGASWSVLVVENNCSDGTRDLVERFQAQGSIPGLRLVSEPRQGAVYARLSGVADSDAEWIAFVDDDCRLAEDWVVQAFAFMAQHPEIGAFGGKNVLQWEIEPSELLRRHAWLMAAQDLGLLPLRLEDRYIAGAGLVMRRKALEASGWLESQVLVGPSGRTPSGGEDTELLLRMRAAGYPIWYNPQCQLIHFIAQRRISEAYLVHHFFHFAQILPWLDGLTWRRSLFSWKLYYGLKLFVVSLLALLRVVGQADRQEGRIWLATLRGQLSAFMAIMRLPPRQATSWLGQVRSAA